MSVSRLLVLYCCLIAAPVFAQLQRSFVVVSKAASLFQSPSTSASEVTKVIESERLRFLRLSSSGRWALVKGRSGQGWIQVDSLVSVPQLSKKSRAEPEGDLQSEPETGATGFSSSDLNVAEGDSLDSVPIASDEQLARFDQKFDKYFVLKRGRLFDKPSRFAGRFGLLEKGDEVQILRQTRGAKWMRVKLLLTGDTGWYPAQWIELRQMARLDRFKPFTLELGLGFGSNGTRTSLGVGAFYNLKPKGFQNAPRDRLEVGLSEDYFLGEAFVSDNISVKAAYSMFSLGVRYITSSDDGVMSGGLEAGPLVRTSIVTSAGTTSQVLEASGIDPGSTRLGLLVGFVGYWASSESLQWMAGARMYLATSSSVAMRAGLTFRF
jgi:hypothetical protein